MCIRDRYSFDGFMMDQIYSIELMVKTQEDIDVKTERIIFGTEYVQPDIHVKPNVLMEYEESRINIEWARDRFSSGKPSADCDYEFIHDFPFNNTTSIWIKKGKIEYDELRCV